jgi:hypothetical protein
MPVVLCDLGGERLDAALAEVRTPGRAPLQSPPTCPTAPRWSTPRAPRRRLFT